MSSNKQAIQTALHQFNQSELFEAGINLFNTLGYKTSRQNRLDDSSKDGFKSSFVGPDDTFDESKALLNDWRQVDLLFQLTQAEVMNEMSLFDAGTVDRTRIEAYLFWAIDLLPRVNNDKSPKPYSRTDLAQATRELNRLFLMPCLVLFRHDGCLTLAIIDRRLHKRDATRDVLEKVTLIKDIELDNTHPGHLSILSDLSFDELHRQHRFDSFVALHRAWQKTLDTSLLNKRFYEESFTWYLWAKSHPQLWFPKPDEEKFDDEAYRSVSVIRLLTRLIFVWFIKEKGLVPDQLFNQHTLKELLKEFNASSAQAADFYRAILQNLSHILSTGH